MIRDAPSDSQKNNRKAMPINDFFSGFVLCVAPFLRKMAGGAEDTYQKRKAEMWKGWPELPRTKIR